MSSCPDAVEGLSFVCKWSGSVGGSSSVVSWYERAWHPSTLALTVLWNVAHLKSRFLISKCKHWLKSEGEGGAEYSLLRPVLDLQNTFRFQLWLSTILANMCILPRSGRGVYSCLCYIYTDSCAPHKLGFAHRLLRRQRDVNSIWLRRYWISAAEHFGSDQVSTVCRSLFHVRNPKTPNSSRELFLQLQRDQQPYESASLKQGQQQGQQQQQQQQQQQHQQPQHDSGPHHNSSLPSDLAWYRLEKLLNERFCRRSTLWHDIN